MKRTLAVAYFLAALTLTPEAYAQTCDAPRRCLSADQVDNVARVLCAKDAERARQFDGLRLELDEANAGWHQCRGAGLTLQAERDALLLEVQSLRDERSARWPWFVWFGLGIVIPVATGAAVLLAF